MNNDNISKCNPYILTHRITRDTVDTDYHNYIIFYYILLYTIILVNTLK